MENLTKGMLIDVDSYEGMDIISNVPELYGMPSWRDYNGKVNKNKLAKYIIYVYSFDSFLNNKKARLPLNDRKLKAFKYCNMLNGAGNVDDTIMEWVYWLKEPAVLDMVLDYLRLQRNEHWTQIILLETELDENNRVRLTPLDEVVKEDLKKMLDKVKSIKRNESKAMVSELEDLYKKFYGDFVDVKDANRKRMTTIENIAQDLLADVSGN